MAPVSRTTLIAALVLAGCGRIGFGLGGGAGGGGGGDGNSGGDGASAPDDSSGTSLIKAIGAGTVTVWDDTVNSSRAVELQAGTQDGDLLVMHATWAVNFGTWTAPSLGGWTATVAPWTDPHCNYSASAVYMKVAVAITMMPAAQAICTGYCVAAIDVFRGIDTTTPFDAIGTPGTTTEPDGCGENVSPQMQVVPGLTTTTDGDVIVLLYGDNNDNNVPAGTSTQTLPAGFTTLYNDLQDAGGSQDFAGGYLAQSNAGVVPAQTIVTTNENLDGWTGVMLALKPAPP